MLEQPLKNTKSPITAPKKYDDHPYHLNIGSIPPPPPRGTDADLQGASVCLNFTFEEDEPTNMTNLNDIDCELLTTSENILLSNQNRKHLHDVHLRYHGVDKIH